MSTSWASCFRKKSSGSCTHVMRQGLRLRICAISELRLLSCLDHAIESSRVCQMSLMYPCSPSLVVRYEDLRAHNSHRLALRDVGRDENQVGRSWHRRLRVRSYAIHPSDDGVTLDSLFCVAPTMLSSSASDVMVDLVSLGRVNWRRWWRNHPSEQRSRRDPGKSEIPRALATSRWCYIVLARSGEVASW